MNNTLLDTVAACSKDLMKFGFSVEEFATLVQENNMTDAEVLAVAKVFEHLKAKKDSSTVQLLSYSVHGSIFPQIHPVVKAVLGDLHSICLVSLDLADRTASALLDEQRIQDTDIDAVLMQCSSYRLMVAAGGLHDNAGIFSQCDDGVSHLLQTDFGMEKFLWQQCHLTHWPQGCHHAFPFGNIDPYCVHVVPPSD